MTFGSLFAGIGGLDLGLERAGMTCAWQVEIDDYAQRVLAKHWPDVPRFRDVREVGAHNLPPVDLICGGFPCQDISNAGKRAGIDGERSGLWAEYARVVREVRPRYVLVENVAALLARGLGRVLGDLASGGYDAEWDCIPASAVGAPHRRDRLWIVAYAVGGAGWVQPEPEPGSGGAAVAGDDGATGDVAHASGLTQREPADEAHAHALATRRDARDEPGHGRADVANPDISGLEGWLFHRRGAGERLARARREALAGVWSAEPDVGRVAHGIPSRVDRLKGLGNAVVPQVAEFIGRRILAHAEAA